MESKRLKPEFFIFVILLMLFSVPALSARMQVSDLPEIVITERPPAMIDSFRSDLSISGFQSEPFSLELEVRDSTGAPVSDDLFGPYTYFQAEMIVRDPRGVVVQGAVDPIRTVSGIGRFDNISLLVTPGVYSLEIVVRIVFEVSGLGSTSLILDSASAGSLMVGVEPSATPLPTATTDPFAGTPPVYLTLQANSTAAARVWMTHQAQIQVIATALVETPSATPFCPPTDPFGCIFPTSTDTPTGTATPTSTATPPPVIATADGDFTLSVPSRGAAFQNDVSGPQGDTSDIIELQFSLLEITQPTNFSVVLACTANSDAVASIVETGAVIACGRSSVITVSPLQTSFHVFVTSLATRAQTRTPYTLSITLAR